jgi:hypothetical protein
MIPFDLDQFDEVHERGKTTLAIEGIAKRFLGRSGVERDGAALVLSRLYTRWAFSTFRPCSYLESYSERIQRIA